MPNPAVGIAPSFVSFKSSVRSKSIPLETLIENLISYVFLPLKITRPVLSTIDFLNVAKYEVHGPVLKQRLLFCAEW